MRFRNLCNSAALVQPARIYPALRYSTCYSLLSNSLVIGAFVAFHLRFYLGPNCTHNTGVNVFRIGRLYVELCDGSCAQIAGARKRVRMSRNILFFSCSFSFHPALLRLPEANPNRSEKRVSSRPRSIRVACRSSPSMPVFTFRVAVREKAFSESFITFLSRPFLCRLPYTFPICLLFFRVFFVRTKTAAMNYLSTISCLLSFVISALRPVRGGVKVLINSWLFQWSVFLE